MHGKKDWKKDSNRLVLESENYRMEVYGYDTVPVGALWILHKYEDSKDRVLVLNVGDNEEELIEEALGFLSFASVEPKKENIFGQYSIISSFSVY